VILQSFETAQAVKTIETIIRWGFPDGLIKVVMSNDCAFFSIIEQAGEGLDMLREFSPSDDYIQMAL
jgi:hypothetical protein